MPLVTASERFCRTTAARWRRSRPPGRRPRPRADRRACAARRTPGPVLAVLDQRRLARRCPVPPPHARASNVLAHVALRPAAADEDLAELLGDHHRVIAGPDRVGEHVRADRGGVGLEDLLRGSCVHSFITWCGDSQARTVTAEAPAGTPALRGERGPRAALFVFGEAERELARMPERRAVELPGHAAEHVDEKSRMLRPIVALARLPLASTLCVAFMPSAGRIGPFTTMNGALPPVLARAAVQQEASGRTSPSPSRRRPAVLRPGIPP